MKKESRLVYSTETGRIKNTEKSTQKPVASTDGIVRLQRQTKGRNGKGVVIITGLALADAELKTLAKQLKQFCGTGGAVKNDTIEIQGDQREKIKQFLGAKGHQVKLAGG